MSLASIWSDVISFYQSNDYIINIASILLAAVILHTVLSSIHKKVRRKLAESKRGWDDAVTYAIYFPLKLILWGFTIFVCIDIFNSKFELVFYDFAAILYKLIVLAAFVAFAVLFAGRFQYNLLNVRKAKVDYMTINAVSKIYYIAIAMLAALVALQILGIPLSAVIAFGGVGGIAIGFAARDFLANLFGGLMIFIGRPFVIGDWIRSPDRAIEGIVEEMGWRQVRLRTFEKRPLYVPNSLFSTIILENVSRMFCRKIEFELSLRYEDIKKVTQITEDLEKYILGRDDIDKNHLNYVKMTGFAESWLTIKVSCYPKTKALVECLSIQQELFVRSVEIIEEHDAELAFNTLTLVKPEDMTS